MSLNENEVTSRFWKRSYQSIGKIGYEVVRQRGSHIRLRDASDPSHKPRNSSLNFDKRTKEKLEQRKREEREERYKYPKSYILVIK